MNAASWERWATSGHSHTVIGVRLGNLSGASFFLATLIVQVAAASASHYRPVPRQRIAQQWRRGIRLLQRARRVRFFGFLGVILSVPPIRAGIGIWPRIRVGHQSL
jgi:hypothetical protein